MKRTFINPFYFPEAAGAGGGGTQADEEKTKLLTAIQKQTTEELEKRGYQDKAAVEAVITEKLKGLDLDSLRAYDKDKETIKNLASELEKLKSLGNPGQQDMSIRAQIATWQKDNKELLDKLKEGRQVDLPVLHIRAATTMTVSGSLGGSTFLPRVQVAPGVVDLVRNQPTFWNRLSKGRTSANPYVWVNKVNKQGNAQFIGEGVLKPLASFELQTESSIPKKVAESMKVSTEMLYDVDGMETMISDELNYEVMMAANTAVLTGTASSTSPAGVTTLASLYTLTGVQTTNPNNADAIRAAIAQLKVLNFDRQIEAYINPVDGANLDMKKSTEGVYVLPPFTTPDGRTIAGVTVIEDNSIAPGYLLIGDMSKYKIAMYQDFYIAWGWENDDFRKNLVTAIGEMRFHQYMSSNHAGAFIYDTFANIKTAITAA
jgi:hypothetical protein